MKSRASAALLIAAALLVASCGGGGEDVDEAAPGVAPSTSDSSAVAVAPGDDLTVASADGRASLTIPAGALPEGVNIGSITVAPLDPGSAPEVGNVVAAYRLEPSGMAFDAPVTLVLDVAVQPDSALLAILVSDDGVEPLSFDVSSRRADGQSDSATLSLNLQHFSDLLVLAADDTDFGFRAEITSPTQFDHFVGVPFTLRTVIELSDFERETEGSYSGFDGTAHYEATFGLRVRPTDGPWYPNSPDLEVRGPVAVTPTSARGGPATERTHSVDRQLTCTSDGEYTVGVVFRYTNRPVTHQTVYLSGPRQGEVTEHPASQSAAPLRLGIQGRCVVPPTSTPQSVSIGADLKEGDAAIAVARVSVPTGKMIVFELDGVLYGTAGLSVIGAHRPFCTYTHVHGPEITSIVPGPDGRPLKRTEHLAECGFGEPNFKLIDQRR